MKAHPYILTLCIVNLACCIHANAQSPSLPFSIAWQRFYGGSSTDDNDYINNTLAATADGGYIFTGETSSNDGDVSGNHGGTDAWVCKIDAGGQIQWQRCIGGSGWEQGQNIIATSDGGYLVGISTESSDGDVVGYHGKGDVLLFKMDANGNVQWKKTMGSGKYDDCADIMQNPDGTYMFAGITEGNDDDVSGNHGKGDAWVVKLAANGNILWQKCYGGTNYDGDYAHTQIIPGIGGGYLLASSTNSSDTSITGLHGKPGKKWTSSTTDLGDAWLVKLDNSGNIQWQKCFGGPIWDFFENIIQTQDGNYLGSGGTQGAGGDIPGNNGAPGTADWWLAKISPSGDLVWSRNYGGTGAEAIHGKVFELPNGDLVIPSGTRSNDHDCIGISGAPDLWIVKTDPVGNILSYNIFGGAGYENLSYAVMNSDGSLTVAAMKDSTTNDFAHDQQSDLWILKLNPNPADTFALTTTSLSQHVACPNYAAFNLNAGFVKRGTFNSGNIFYAELSDGEGSFASPLTIGTLTGTIGGTINCTVPAGLAPGKYYAVRVRSTNPAYMGITSGQLLTIQPCAAPGGLFSSNLTASGVTLKWNPVPCAIQYKLQYSKSPNAAWTNVSTTDSVAVISGLNASATYFWRVQTKCSSSPNVWSDWSITRSFTTPSLRMGETLSQAGIRIMPNPVQQQARISFSLSKAQHIVLRLFDLGGRMVSTLIDKKCEEGENEMVWDTSEVNAGMYLLKFQSEENLQTEKLTVTK